MCCVGGGGQHVYHTLCTHLCTHARTYTHNTHMHTHLCPVAWRHGSAGVAKVPDVDLALACSRDEEVGLEGVDVQAPHGPRVVVRLMDYHIGAPTGGGGAGGRKGTRQATRSLVHQPSQITLGGPSILQLRMYIILNTILFV